MALPKSDIAGTLSHSLGVSNVPFRQLLFHYLPYLYSYCCVHTLCLSLISVSVAPGEVFSVKNYRSRRRRTGV